ncbi:hypothetical protein VTL71DRAFT_1928 [Oculimacula yallundae]|uniref:Uncharacterized protein n=1 Tax=Oculimacula yallundae TaxID=86028 RepID=A0ABR4CC40_9HELO
MASPSSTQEAPLLSFLSLTRSCYAQEGIQTYYQRLSLPESADTMLTRDIAAYELYLDQQGAYTELAQFLGLCHRIREAGQEYDFSSPSQLLSDATPSFSTWRSETSQLGRAYQYPLMYDTYAKCISSIATPLTVAAYISSRELITEGDRRWLYGLSRHDLPLDITRLHLKRKLIRHVLESAQSLNVEGWIELFKTIQTCLTKRLVSISVFLARDVKLSMRGHQLLDDDLMRANGIISCFWESTSASHNVPLPVSPAPSTESESDSATESNQEEEGEESNPPLSRHEWRQLALEIEAEHDRGRTAEEFLHQWREDLVQELQCEELSDEEDENPRIRRLDAENADNAFLSGVLAGSSV